MSFHRSFVFFVVFVSVLVVKLHHALFEVCIAASFVNGNRVFETSHFCCRWFWSDWYRPGSWLRNCDWGRLNWYWPSNWMRNCDWGRLNWYWPSNWCWLRSWLRNCYRLWLNRVILSNLYTTLELLENLWALKYFSILSWHVKHSHVATWFLRCVHFDLPFVLLSRLNFLLKFKQLSLDVL